ncbi:YggS family pyridoxal phosphate-dependent enzyme [Actinopolymorpha alba]|uniref:YggS family pyridoxal phosphate-dependent enzyme n=1 Tax=Actinopolymorpha alba TaxID=533267 RepID=UPI00039B7E4C|nr:YggS family pyridoxal phosphate-dependent enzyme [Actinopolymorpha alba]
MDRRTQVADNLAAVRARIARACEDAGRDPGEVTLVAVTKTFPASDVRLLAGLGVRDVGESRDQEASAKAEACADLDLTWHFVGQLQTNKARSVVRYASVVHSVDRPSLVTALSRAAAEVGQSVRCLVQVRLDERPGRGGADPMQVSELAASIAEAPGLALAGVMAVAPMGADPGPSFARLAGIAADLRAEHPEARWMSAGMSEDLEAAIEAGATHVRIGRRLLGARPRTG